MLVLNIDDDLDDREIFLEAIRMIDFSISCIQFDGCQKAIEYLNSGATFPDVIFMDINMPKMNGYECVGEMRRMFKDRNLNIVMYSTTFNPHDQVNFGEMGAQYLVKSSTMDNLVSNLKKAINLLEGESRK